MKECPVCKETFSDDYNFCDLDGTSLDGAKGAPSTSSRVWSLLGVGLLLGALAIVAGAIIYFPRGPSASQNSVKNPDTTASNPKPQAVPDSSPPVGLASPAPGQGGGLDAAAKLGSDAGSGESADVGPPASHKDAEARDANGPALPNPKQAAAEAEKDLSGKTPADDTRPRVVKSPDDLKTGADNTSLASTSDRNASAAKTRKDASGRRPVASADSTPDDAMPDRKPERKKGGFLKVFKKIFGQH